MAGDHFVHPTAEVSPLASVGAGTKIWNQAQVRAGAVLGAECVIGKDVYIDQGVSIGNHVKIQNSVSVYHGVNVEDGVFIGPNVAFTNDRFPRADNSDWQVVPTVIRRGASIGANATIVCGVTIGERAMVGAGAVVTKDVPPYALVVGNPARILRWLQPASESVDAPIQVMLVGYGSMGSKHARVLSSLPRVYCLRVIADPDDSRREMAGKHHPGTQLLSDWRQGLQQVQAVVVASPTETHLTVATEVLTAGKHCLLEKPCTLSANSASTLYALATEQGVLLQVGHCERFNPAVEALLQLVQGEEIVALSSERLGLSSQQSDIVFDLAIHDLEIAQALLAQPARCVEAKGFGLATSGGYATAIVEYADGILATLTVSRVTPWRRRTFTVTTKRALYVADCLNRTVTVYRMDGELMLADQQSRGSVIWEFAGADPLTRQALAFAASLKQNVAPVVSSATVLPSLQVAEIISRQIGSRR